MATSSSKSRKSAQTNSPGVLVLQWLTYAFWGWTILALTYLVAISVNFFLDPVRSGYSESETIAYSLAAVLVLFIISLVCDLLYARREPSHKTGAATVIMIIHAVIFALCGIAAVIVAVFAVVNMLIDTVGAGNQTALYTGLIISVVYAATLLRTIRPSLLRARVWPYWVFMAAVGLAVAAMGVFGPVVNAQQTRDDRLIESGLGGVSVRINNYARENGKLPASLDDVRSKLRGDSATIVERGLVEYMPGQEVPLRNGFQPVDTPVYEYDLCVTYKSAKGDAYDYEPRMSGGEVAPSTYSHDAGRVCYDLQTEYTY